MNERYVYILETKLYTFRGYFDAQTPTASEVFSKLLELQGRKLIGNYVFKKSTVSITEMKIVEDIAYILLRVTNPDIPDNRYFSESKDEMRDVNREGDEEPAISCHVVIDLSSHHDIFRSYPTTLENVPFLSRSIVLYTLNNILADHLREDRKWTPKNGDETEKPFIPKIRHQSPQSETINGLIDANGKLKDVEIIEETLREEAAFDNAVPHKELRSIKLIPEGASTPAVIKDFIKRKVTGLDFAKVKKVSVSIADPNHGKLKVIKVDTNRTDMLDSAFIPQKLIKDIEPALLVCEDDFHDQLTAEMKKLL